MATPTSHRTAASTFAAGFAPTGLTSNASLLVASVHALLATKTGSGQDYADAETYLAQAEAAANAPTDDFRTCERLARRAQISAFLAS